MLFLFLILLISSLSRAASKLDSSLREKLNAGFIRAQVQINDAHAENNGCTDVVEMDGIEGPEQPKRPGTPFIKPKKDPLDGM